MRSYLKDGSCPAEPKGMDESTALAIAIAAPIIEKGVEVAVDAAMKKIAAYGNSLAQPMTLKSGTYPGKTTLEDIGPDAPGCVFIAYGRYGGVGGSNIRTGDKALGLYAGSDPAKHLTSNVGFAMQIGVDVTDEKVSLTPLHLFYPRAFHTGSSVDKHSLSVEANIGAEKVVMHFEEIQSGYYYAANSLATQKQTVNKSALDAGTINFTIIEGPDNKLLGEALADFASDEETRKKLVGEIQSLVNDRLQAEKSGEKASGK